MLSESTKNVVSLFTVPVGVTLVGVTVVLCIPFILVLELTLTEEQRRWNERVRA